MKEPLGVRVVRLRQLKHWKQAELVRASGLPKQTISNIETGRTPNPGFETVQRIATALQVTPGELLGASARDIGPEDGGATGELARAIAAQVTKSIRELLDTDRRLRRVSPIPHDQQRIPAGGITPMDEVYTDLPGDTSRLVALTVRGHCMEPDIRDGETVIIDTERPAELKDVVAVYLEGDWTLKRLRRRNGVWLLVPDNTDYQPIEIDPTKVRVLGVVVQVSRGKP